MTVLEIVRMALKESGVLGVGQSASAEDSNDAFTKLNMMLGIWNAKRWLVYHLLDLPLTSTGALSYTVGPGGDFNTPRPDRLEAAFVRQTISSPSPVDYPLALLESREDYNRIAVKNLGTYPNCIFYDSGWPLGTVYPYPVPQAGIYAIHLTVKAQISQFTSLSQEISLPAVYLEALLYNLACRLRPAYQLAPEPSITALAMGALQTIRASNAQVPRLVMPRGLVMPRNGWGWAYGAGSGFAFGEDGFGTGAF